MPGSVSFHFEGFGFTQVERSFRTKGEHGADIVPALIRVRDAIRGILTEQFMTEGAHGGTRWEKLADATVAFKRDHDLRPEILRATDRLFESLTEESHADAIRVITSQELHFGSTVRYGLYHQRGNPNLPQRKIFNFNEMERRELVKILQRWLMTGEI